MSLTLTNEAKNTLTLTNENKPTGGTFGSEPARTFADGGTFGEPAFFLNKEAKNTLNLTLETK